MLRRESAHEGMLTNPPAPLTRHHSHHLLWHQRERFFLKKDSGSRSSACTATNPSSQPHLLGTRPALTQWRPRTRMRQGPDTPSFFTLHFAEWCGVTISYEPLAWATGIRILIRMTLLFAKQPSFSFFLIARHPRTTIVLSALAALLFLVTSRRHATLEPSLLRHIAPQVECCNH